MTREDILKLAREADPGFEGGPEEDGTLPNCIVGFNAIERFFRLAHESGAAAEREACADICDQHASIEGVAQRCAAEIRARGNT